LSEKNNSHDQNKTSILNIDEKFQNFAKNPIIAICTIAFIAFLVRIYYFPYGIPIVLDGWAYFWYGIDMSILEEIPQGYNLSNNGWPTFLSIFFMLFNLENYLDYMTLQRFLTVIISVLTIIPIYLLCRKFFDKFYAVLGSALFVLDPRIIINSLAGITEPLFILLVTISLVLFLSHKTKGIYLSFIVAALSALIRYESLLLIIPYSIMFIIRFRKEKFSKLCLRYFFVLAIFTLVLLPMAYIRIQTMGNDGLISHVSSGPLYLSEISQTTDEKKNLTQFFITAIERFPRYFGLAAMPTFIVFIPFGILMFLKKIDYNKTTIILITIFLLLPSFYVYGRGYFETRYLYIVFPIFCIFSSYAFHLLDSKIRIPGIFSVLLIVAILIVSVIWLNYEYINLNHEKEAFDLSFKVRELTTGINEFYPESTYLQVTILADKEFPTLSKDVPLSNSYVATVDIPKFISAKGFNSIEEFIATGKDKGLTHLVIDGLDESNPRRVKLFNDVFYNEYNYPYLIKEYDSVEDGYNYHLKIFRIDYQLFENMKLYSSK